MACLLSQQFAKASQLLLSSAAQLSEVVEQEAVFWNEVLAIRRKNWLLQSGAAGPSGFGRNFVVQYGFDSGTIDV